MKTVAAVLVRTGAPLEIMELDIPKLRPGQALVEIAYSGVCHTQVLEAQGAKGPDPYLPHCMGHEGTGTVVDIGPEVRKVSRGNRVILSWLKGSGLDATGTVYIGPNGLNVNAGAITTFCTYSVISENRLTLLPDSMSLEQAPLVGCAVATGIGAVFHTATVERGMHVAVLGAGGIGLCATSGARIRGALSIIAVDVNPLKLELARAMGATHAITPGDDIVSELRTIIPSGMDVTVEATGKPSIMRAAFESVRPHGGIAVIIGNSPVGGLLQLDPKHFNMGKQLRGSWGGGSVPDRDFPHYCELIMEKALDLSPLSSKRYPLSKVNQALEDLAAGKTVRPIIKN